MTIEVHAAAAVRARVTAAWVKGRELVGVIGDINAKEVETKLYACVQPLSTLCYLYGAESWTMGKKEERILEATEMRMLRGVTLWKDTGGCYK